MKSTITGMAAALVLSSLAFQTASAGDAAAGKASAGTCAGCHGANGEGMGPNPKLAGMDPAEFTAKMKDFKAGKGNPTMVAMSAAVSDDDIANIAAYYASLK